MPPRDWLLRIEDILEAAASIEAFVAGMSFDDFCSDKKTMDAVVRNFEVIGEAARHVPEETRGRYPDVPWVDMADMRNVLIHEYFGVDFVILWEAIHADLRVIVPLLEEILEQNR